MSTIKGIGPLIREYHMLPIFQCGLTESLVGRKKDILHFQVSLNKEHCNHGRGCLRGCSAVIEEERREEVDCGLECSNNLFERLLNDGEMTHCVLW